MDAVQQRKRVAGEGGGKKRKCSSVLKHVLSMPEALAFIPRTKSPSKGLSKQARKAY